MVKTLHADQALLPNGWQRDVEVAIGDDGRIVSVRNASSNAPDVSRTHCGIMLAAPANLHSHAFQRAMAGMTEARGPSGMDSFWTWRQLMFRFLDHLTPDDIEAITAFAQMEMLEAGFASVAEFHYLHHQPGGAPYDNIAEMAERIAAAAEITGIGLTLLPVLYQFGGCDGRALSPGQIRFGNDTNSFAALHDASKHVLRGLPSDTNIGLAPHSLRAVNRDGMQVCAELGASGPVHIHAAEQVAEVDEVKAALGLRPVEWLLENHAVNERWCFIHATQMLPHETLSLAQSGAVAGLCPITEASLGDGVFDGATYLNANGNFGIGTDSNIRISLIGELSQLEYSQRLRDKKRAVLATATRSTGRNLYTKACQGGSKALGRSSGTISVGAWADLVILDSEVPNMIAKDGDSILDAMLFAGDKSLITDVYCAGRHVVCQGKHRSRDAIVARYKSTMVSLRGRI